MSRTIKNNSHLIEISKRILKEKYPEPWFGDFVIKPKGDNVIIYFKRDKSDSKPYTITVPIPRTTGTLNKHISSLILNLVEEDLVTLDRILKKKFLSLLVYCLKRHGRETTKNVMEKCFFFSHRIEGNNLIVKVDYDEDYLAESFSCTTIKAFPYADIRKEILTGNHNTGAMNTLVSLLVIFFLDKVAGVKEENSPESKLPDTSSDTEADVSLPRGRDFEMEHREGKSVFNNVRYLERDVLSSSSDFGSRSYVSLEEALSTLFKEQILDIITKKEERFILPLGNRSSNPNTEYPLFYTKSDVLFSTDTEYSGRKIMGATVNYTVVSTERGIGHVPLIVTKCHGIWCYVNPEGSVILNNHNFKMVLHQFFQDITMELKQILATLDVKELKHG